MGFVRNRIHGGGVSGGLLPAPRYRYITGRTATNATLTLEQLARRSLGRRPLARRSHMPKAESRVSPYRPGECLVVAPNLLCRTSRALRFCELVDPKNSCP